MRFLSPSVTDLGVKSERHHEMLDGLFNHWFTLFQCFNSGAISLLNFKDVPIILQAKLLLDLKYF